MQRLQSRKFCAALVIIAWLATLVSLWGMLDAGRRAVAPEPSKPRSCEPKDLQNMGLRLEMADQAAMEILTSGTDPAKCVRRGTAAQVYADYLLIPAYSGLTLALFLFVRVVRLEPSPSPKQKALGLGLLVLGLLLAVAMFFGDVFENRQLTEMINLAERGQPLPNELLTRLSQAGHLKWGALAASALLLALLWDAKSSSKSVLALRLLGLAATGLFVFGLFRSNWETVSYGLATLSAFWLAALIHAVTVAVETEPIQVAQPQEA